MPYCHRHNTNNCIECAIEKQTEQIIETMKRLATRPPKPPTLWQKIKRLITGAKT